MKQKLRFIGTAFIAFFIVVSIFLNQTKVNAEDTNEICIPDLIQQAIGDESEAPYTCVEGDYFLKLYSNGYLIISPNESERYAEDYSNDSEIHDMFTTSVTNVIIDDGITRIHDYFFCDYMNTIHNIIMSDTVTEIGEGAFSNCSAENVRLSNNLETIADYAFNSACIINMPLPNSVTSIGNYAFMYYGYNRCANPVIIPDSVLELGEGIFYGSGVSIVELPDNLTYIPNYTFSYCEWLTEVNIPTSALWIGEQALIAINYIH